MQTMLVDTLRSSGARCGRVARSVWCVGRSAAPRDAPTPVTEQAAAMLTPPGTRRPTSA